MERRMMMDIWILQLCFIFDYHHFCCSNAQENQRICTSPCNQCNFTFVCDPPPPAFCIRENIALGKKVNMSSMYEPQNSSVYNITYAACTAFDGYRNTVYTGIQPFTSPNCIHTMNVSEEWLQVDLGKKYTVTNITVYRRSNALDQEIDRLANILITVDNQQCYQFPENVTGFPEEIHVQCSSPLTGRIVKLSTHNQYLNLCEIEVWVCTSGLYGKTCDGVCRCKNNATCDNYYGTCPTGCDAGYYGLNCSLQCGQCLDMSQCNVSGHCLTGCQNGWQGPTCDDCLIGFFGPQCKKCGYCRDSLPCNSSTGLCSNGCIDGYERPLCNEIQQNCDQDQTGAIVGSVLGAGVLISVSVIAVLIWFRRTSRNEKQPQAPKSKVTQAASRGNQAMQDLNFHEDTYEGLETQEEVAKPYTVLGKESHDSNTKHQIAVDNNYEKIATQYQNTSVDWKPYEVLVSPPQRTNTRIP